MRLPAAPVHLLGVMKPAPLVVAGLLPVLLAACGSPRPAADASRPAPTAAPTTAPTPSPTPARPVVALLDDAAIRLVTLDGRELAHVARPQTVQPAGVGGGMAVFVDGDQLRGLRGDGGVETLGRLAGYTGGRVLVSPDGRQWIWSRSTIGQAGSTSEIVLGGRGAADRTVARLTSGPQARVLMPYRWTAGGPVYHSMAAGLGGYVLFEYVFAPAWRLDAETGQVAPLAEACQVADLAADGALACLAGDVPSGFRLEVTRAGGDRLRLALPRPRFNQSGAVSFRPGAVATALVVAGATGEGADRAGTERFETDLVDLATGAMRPFGPAGLRPGDGAWTWLPDGSLLAYRPILASASGDPGLYVVAPDGGARRVFGPGTPFGVMTEPSQQRDALPAR